MLRESLQALYAVFACAAAGCLMALALLEWRAAKARAASAVALFGLLFVAASAGALLAQFGRPAMVFAAFANPGSAIFRELASIVLAFIAGAVYWLALFSGAKAATMRRLGSVAAFAGLVLALACGSSLVMSWRPAWNTWTLVLPSAGFAGLAAAAAVFAGEARSLGLGLAGSGAALSRIRAAEAAACGAGERSVGVHSSQVLFGALLPVLGIGCYFAALVLANGGAWAQRLTMLFSGEGALLFAGGTLGLGVVVPAIGLWLARGRVRQAAAGAALFWAALAFLAASMGAGCWHRAVLLLG